MHSFRDRVTGEQGAAAVEFALIAGVLFMLLFGTLQFGHFYSQYQVLQGAAREGARVAATRGADWQDAVYQAAQPYTPSSSLQISQTCTSYTVGQPVAVSWSQRFRLELPFIPAVTKNVPIRGVFRCE